MTRYILWGIACGLIIGGSGWLSAHADAATIQRPSICASFDAAPTFGTVNAVMYALISNGNSVDKASELLVATVQQHCPQRIGLLQAYVDAGVFLYPEIAK